MPLPPQTSLLCRRLLCCGVLTVCAAVLVRAVVLEPFEIPTGSMAPTLRGRHRVCVCPRCGHEVVVGRARDDLDGKGHPRHYRKTFCSNCGLLPVPITDAEVAGDRILVNKGAFLQRSPRRWEVVLFRLFGTFYIKRLLGLPGETILIHDGDLYVNGELSRKTLAEARAMRVEVFDHDHAPPEGWGQRWQRSALSLDGRVTPDELVYANFLLDTGKCEPIRDEYGYNAGLHADSECVHDFMIETDIEIRSGRGSLTLRLCDGHDQVEVVLPVGQIAPRSQALPGNALPRGSASPTPLSRAADDGSGAPAAAARQSLAIVRSQAEPGNEWVLLPGRRYHVEMAFVDRRLSVAVDGRLCLSRDLPAAKERAGVVRPFSARADGVEACLHRFRMYRDVHYTQQGQNAIRGKSVRMGVDQFFLLGDNSPYSEDSRFWPDQGAVGASLLVGAALFR